MWRQFELAVLPDWIPRLLGRDRFQRWMDMYCGLCILTAYFLYLMLVKGALSVMDCSKVRAGGWGGGSLCFCPCIAVLQANAYVFIFLLLVVNLT